MIKQVRIIEVALQCEKFHDFAHVKATHQFLARRGVEEGPSWAGNSVGNSDVEENSDGW